MVAEDEDDAVKKAKKIFRWSNDVFVEKIEVKSMEEEEVYDLERKKRRRNASEAVKLAKLFDKSLAEWKKSKEII